MIARYLTRDETDIYFLGAWFLGESSARLVRWSCCDPIKPTPAANDNKPAVGSNLRSDND